MPEKNCMIVRDYAIIAYISISIVFKYFNEVTFLQMLY